MTFSEAFYGTYKLDKKDGKPHLKERIFAPVDGFWSGVMIFGGVVGTIILLLTFAAHVQVALGTFAHPADAAFTFREMYDYVKARGYVIYPGKLTDGDTFRIGTIGEIYPADILNVTSILGEFVATKRKEA